jgi:CheY-like chemotaxis protein
MRYKNILLVEDDEDEQELFAQLVQHLLPSAKLTIAANGYKALDVLSNAEPAPDLIFLDIRMPLMDGIELLGLLKTMEDYNTYKHIPVVTLSTSIIDPERKYKLGASLAVLKPNSIKLYRTMLAHIFSHDAGELRSLFERKFSEENGDLSYTAPTRMKR